MAKIKVKYLVAQINNRLSDENDNNFFIPTLFNFFLSGSLQDFPLSLRISIFYSFAIKDSVGVLFSDNSSPFSTQRHSFYYLFGYILPSNHISFFPSELSSSTAIGSTGSVLHVYQLPIAAVMYYHKLSGLKENMCIILQFQRSEV